MVPRKALVGEGIEWRWLESSPQKINSKIQQFYVSNFNFVSIFLHLNFLSNKAKASNLSLTIVFLEKCNATRSRNPNLCYLSDWYANC